MNAYRPPKIADLGLQTYLDNTKSKHDDLGYTEFVKYVNKKINAYNLARLFNVHRHTIERWVEVYEEEIAKKD